MADRTIVCYGDSNTWGFNADFMSGAALNLRLAFDERWTTIMSNQLNSDSKNRYIVIPEGLNGRTVITDDDHDGCNGEYSGPGMNGRRYLMPCLHSHKPIDLVILGLGVNSLKTRLNLSPAEVANGLRTLIKDIKRSTAGVNDSTPPILLVAPPVCRENKLNIDWGFGGCDGRSIALIGEIKALAKAENVGLFDISQVAEVGEDGIHFDASNSRAIGLGMANAVKCILE